MRSEWRPTTLGEFVRLQRGHDLTAVDQVPGPYPVMGSAGQNGTHARWKAKGPGVVIGRSGASIGKVHFVRGDYWPHNTCLYVTNFLGNDERFAFYLLGSLNLANYNSGSAQPSLNRNYIYTKEIVVPPRAEQIEIANFLGDIDDRIDNLRATNVTLEAIAQALFKSWFVDFDPVHAKAEGRAPEGMDAATAALFPSEFEDSELGLVPNGWRIMEIGKAVKCVGGATPSTKEEAYWVDGTHCWATPKDLSGLAAPVLTETARQITDAGLDRISSGLLPNGTLLMSSRAPIGYLAIAGVPTAINQGFIAMLPGGELPPRYLFCWAKANMDAIKQAANGSTFMEISKRAFRPMLVLVPTPAVVSSFQQFSEPLFEQIKLNERTAKTLIDLRDTLLPRLISGKLRLPEAHELTEAEA